MRLPRSVTRPARRAPSPARRGGDVPGRRESVFLPSGPSRVVTVSIRTGHLSWERVEGVSRSLPYSDLLALTSCHMFLSVMNRLPRC